MKYNTYKIIGGILILIACSTVVLYAQKEKVDSLFCTEPTFLFTDKTRVSNALNPDGTIKYFFEDFSEYSSVVLADFENVQNVTSSGEKVTLVTSDDHINGSRSLLITLPKSTAPVSDEKVDVVVNKKSETEINLSAWEGKGMITGWIKVPDRKNVQSIGLVLVDSEGNKRTFDTLENLQKNILNYYETDDAFPNLSFNSRTSAADEWTDFWLNTGWNFLFWKNTEGAYKDTGNFNSEKVIEMQFILSLQPQEEDVDINLDDIRLMSGLQKNDNPLSPNWYPPLGRPQYGIYDIDTDVDGVNSLKLLNVRQNQYLSNGDHGRMLTSGLTPNNFIWRTRFTLENMQGSKNMSNTWLRLMYDFDPEYDPGHDWFGFYSSFEYGKIGLLTVIPIQRFSAQTQEPLTKDISISESSFDLSEDEMYEVQMKVEGQIAEAWLYTVTGDDCLHLKKHITYTFNRERYADKRYPLGIEITGNVSARIYQVEIAEI